MQIYTGGGKGKTTAALGLAFRAAGHGCKTTIIQFMKGQINYGELEAAKKFKGLIKIIQAGRKDFVSKKIPRRSMSRSRRTPCMWPRVPRGQRRGQDLSAVGG